MEYITCINPKDSTTISFTDTESGRAFARIYQRQGWLVFDAQGRPLIV